MQGFGAFSLDKVTAEWPIGLWPGKYLITFYFFPQRFYNLFVPFGEPAPLHHHPVVPGTVEVKMEGKFFVRILPADDLPESKVVEYQGVALALRRVISL